ncbi:copper chaperone PCu(A)C [Ectothiorhodospiraceae bacterium WFHF3C12]|nr:copper chaperone PCu(A)C [Ectothiorhodospiraceae bacterium WFHF3C12]
MMRAHIRAAAVLSALLLFPLAGLAADNLKITDVWARATPPGAPASAAYFRVTTDGPGDKLVGVSSPVAGKAMLHRSVESDGQVSMEHVHDVPLSADNPIVFRPRGYHVMLMQLRRPLEAGKEFPMTLTFEKAGDVEVTVTVKPLGTTMEDMQHGRGGHGD